MRSEAKLTSKGQITVPKEVRRALGVNTGDKVVFEQKGDKISVRSGERTSAFEKYRGIGNPVIGSGRAAVVRAIRDMRDGK